MNLPWFRMYTEAVDDPKLRLLAFEDRWHFIAILCCKGQGIIDTNPELLDRMLAVKLGVQGRELDEIKRRLMEVGLLDERWQPLVWQEKSDRPPAHKWRVIRERIFARDDYTCRYCDARGGRLECDHVMPVSRGGPHDDDNLTTACFYCNRSKRNKTVSE